MAQPIKRTVGFAVAGAEAEPEPEEVQLAFSSDSVHLGEPSLEPGSPNPVLITPHFHGKNTVGSPQSGGGSQGDTRGITEIMRDVRLVAQSGERKPPGAFDLDAKREVERELDARAFAPPAGGPAGLPAGFDPATERTSAPSPLQTQPSDASSMASSGTPATTKTAAKTNASASTASADASADAAKAAAKAAKEARKAAHLAEMEKKGAAAAPKKQLTRAERRAQQEAQKAAKAAKNEGGGDGAGAGAGAPSKKAAAGSSAGDLQKVAAAAGDEASVSSLSSTKEVVGNPARQAQRVERAREAKASAKAKSKHAGGRLSDHFSHLRPFEKPRGGFADARSDVVYARPPRGSVNFSVEKQTEHTEHPAVTRLARLYADGTVTGGRARCAALLHTLKKVVESFEVPPDETYAHALTARVNAVVQHIQSARPMSVSMGNAVKSLKTHLARMSEEHASARGDAAPVASGNVDHASDFESRRKTMAHLEYFEVEKIEKAGRSIAEHGANEISDGDVVATHGLSHHCFEILKEAKRRGVRFGVAVIDSRPNLEGQTQLRRLRAVGVECTYCQLTGLDHVLRKGKVTKVLLGAAAVLANGAVVSRCGAAVVAASAVEYKIPVLVAAETVKFHERVQLDAVAHNELGDPDLVAFGAAVGLETDGIGSGHARDNGNGDKNKNGDTTADPSSVLPSAADAGGVSSASAFAFASPLAGWRSHERLSVLNLKYDSTPASCVRSIVCESGAVAPTDVPSFLR